MSANSTQEKFLKMLRNGPGYFATISQSKNFSQQWFETHDEALELADQYWATHNIYVSLATFPNPRNTRESKHADRLCCFWVDIDHHDNSVYRSVDEIESAMSEFLQKTGLPSPNLKHFTGYGVHYFWALNAQLSVTDWQGLADSLQSLLLALKVAADPITADAARILRLPATQNFRNPENPIETELTVVRDDLVNVDSFERALKDAASKFTAPTLRPINKPSNKSIPQSQENLSYVQAMLECIDPDPKGGGGGNRSVWMRTIWAVASTGWGEQAYTLARKWSESGDLFDEKDFNGVWSAYDPDWGSGAKKGSGFGTLIHFAKTNGYGGPTPKSAPPQPTKNYKGRLITKTAEEYEPLPIDWLVDQSIPLGAMVVVAGEPGLGKSQIAIRLAAAVTTGKGLPNNQPYANIGSVIILANEDDAERTIRPRLEAAGADLAKVHIVEGVAREGEEVDLFQLDMDIAELRTKTAGLGDVRLIVIDPPGAYLGSQVDSYKDTDVRRVLAPIARLAQETGALILLVVHLNKRTDGSPQQRITGSTAWTAAPRAAFIALAQPATKKRYLVPVKNNLGDDQKGFEYRIQEKLLQYPNTTIKTSYVEWVGPSIFSAAELLNPPRSSKSSVVDEAKLFLEDELANGPRLVSDIKASCTSAGLSWASIQRAKRDLSISSTKLADAWQWELIFGGKNV